MARFKAMSIVLLALIGAAFVACGGGNQSPASSPEVVPPAEPPVSEPSPGDSDSPPNPTVGGDAGVPEGAQPEPTAP